MPPTRGRLFLGCRARLNPSIAPVVAHTVYRRVVHYRRVVNVMDVSNIHIGHRLVIEEVSIVPTSAGKTYAEVTESVVDSTVKTHLRTPKALVEGKCTTTPAPPARGPQEADLRCHHPSARHPVVIGDVVIPIPVTGRPEITIAGANGLLIHRQRWRPYRDRYSELRQSPRRHGQHYQCKRQRTK